MAVVPIQSLYVTHLTVSDLDRSIAFYRDVLGLELAHRVPDRHAEFPLAHEEVDLLLVHRPLVAQHFDGDDLA